MQAVPYHIIRVHVITNVPSLVEAKSLTVFSIAYTRNPRAAWGSAQEFLSGGLTWTKVNVMCAGLYSNVKNTGDSQ